MSHKIPCLIVGDTDHRLGVFAKKFDPKAYLVTYDNCDEDHIGVVYTSIGDLKNVQQFCNLLQRSNKIIVNTIDKEKWSDGKTKLDRYSMAWLTYHYCLIVSTRFGIPLESDFSIEDLIDTPAPRLNDLAHTWVAGCSTTYGFAVEENEIYWKPVTDYIGLPVVNLSRPGSSVAWSADQLLRSDLRSGDVIVWGITNSSRFHWYDTKQSLMITDRYYERHPNFHHRVPRFVVADDHWAHESIIAVERVRNMCEKIGVKILLVGIHSDLDFNSYWSSYSDFIPIHGFTGLNFDSDFEDYGKDNLHPGPKTHAKYSRAIIEHLDKINYRNSSPCVL